MSPLRRAGRSWEGAQAMFGYHCHITEECLEQNREQSWSWRRYLVQLRRRWHRLSGSQAPPGQVTTWKLCTLSFSRHRYAMLMGEREHCSPPVLPEVPAPQQTHPLKAVQGPTSSPCRPSQPPRGLPLLLLPPGHLELLARYPQSPRSLQDTLHMQPTFLNLSSQDTSLHTTLIVTYVCALNFSRKHGETTVSRYGKTEILNYRTDGLVILFFFLF